MKLDIYPIRMGFNTVYVVKGEGAILVNGKRIQIPYPIVTPITLFKPVSCHGYAYKFS